MSAALRPVPKGILPEIDGLRGVAIFLVFFTHFWPHTGLAAGFWPVAQAGWVGVDLFFVISGFLIMGILLDTKGSPGYYRSFYARRILRIFPLYYLFLAAVFITMPLLQGASYATSAFGRQAGSPLWYLFYLTNFREVVVAEGVPPFIRPLWSLAIEEQFYLIFPLLVALLSRRAITRLLVGLVVGAIVLRTAMLITWPENHELQYLLTPARFDTIAMGCLGAVAIRSDRFQRWRPRLRGAPIAAVMLLAVVGITSRFDRRDGDLRSWGYTAIAAAFLLFLLWTVDRIGAGVTAPLRGRFIRYCGKLCYGLYVLHIGAWLIASRVLARLVPGLAEPDWLRFPIGVASALVVATLSWKLFEQPILRLKSRFSYRARPDLA